MSYPCCCTRPAFCPIWKFTIPRCKANAFRAYQGFWSYHDVMPNREDDTEKYVEKQFAEMATAEEMSRVIRDLPDLVASVESADLCACLPSLSGLMTIPELQPNLIRLEALVHMVVARAAGKVQANRDLIEKWLNVDLAADILMRVEDPVEDVFVANVVTGGGNRRIFTGVWETPDFWLQSLLDVLSVAPRIPQLQRIRAETDALLKLSEAVAERTRASRFSISKGTPYVQISLPSETGLLEIASRCRFNPEDLNELGIRRELLGPFVFEIESREQLTGQKVGESGLQRRPLVICGDTLVLAIPQAVASALRVYVLEAVAGLGSSSLAPFEHVLRRMQSDLLFGEAVRFSKGLKDVSKTLPPSSIDDKRFSQVAVRFDEGKFAHIVLLHDSCEEVLNEGLTTKNSPPERFAKKLVSYLEGCAKAFASSSGYVGGLTLVAMGGIGRGFALMPPMVPNGWMFSVWSLADVYALGWQEHEWLLSLWKLNRQLAQTEESQIEIHSSDANLYSFWKENRYQLIPREYPVGRKHGTLALGPEFIAPFRQAFRASFDAHGVYRPDERSWIVVRKTFPIGFFKELESLPMYASPDDAAHGQLRGLFHGVIFQNGDLQAPPAQVRDAPWRRLRSQSRLYRLPAQPRFLCGIDDFQLDSCFQPDMADKRFAVSRFPRGAGRHRAVACYSEFIHDFVKMPERLYRPFEDLFAELGPQKNAFPQSQRIAFTVQRFDV